MTVRVTLFGLRVTVRVTLVPSSCCYTVMWLRSIRQAGHRRRTLVQARSRRALGGAGLGRGACGRAQFAVTARRELREEMGLHANRPRLVDVYSGPEFFVTYPNGDQAYVVGALFVAEEVGGNPAADGQASTEVGYFAWDALPDDIDPNHRRLLERCREKL